MKKLFYAAMLLLGLGIVGASCSKVSTDDYATAIVGRWRASKVVAPNGQSSTSNNDDEGLILIFTESGQFVLQEGPNADKGSYWVEGKSLYMSSWGTTEKYTISKLTGRELVLQIDNEDISMIYFNRIE